MTVHFLPDPCKFLSAVLESGEPPFPGSLASGFQVDLASEGTGIRPQGRREQPGFVPTSHTLSHPQPPLSLVPSFPAVAVIPLPVLSPAGQPLSQRRQFLPGNPSRGPGSTCLLGSDKVVSARAPPGPGMAATSCCDRPLGPPTRLPGFSALPSTVPFAIFPLFERLKSGPNFLVGP